MATGESPISFTLTELENLGHLLRLFHEVEQTNPSHTANGSSSQFLSQHVSPGRFNARAHDVETHLTNDLTPRNLADLIAIVRHNRYVSRHLSIETPHLERGELRVLECQKTPEPSHPYHLDDQRIRNPYIIPGQFDDTGTDPGSVQVRPTGQIDGTGSQHIKHAHTAKSETFERQLRSPEPVHIVRVQPDAKEENYGQTQPPSPYVSRWRSLDIYARSLEGPRSWRRPSTARTTRRSMSHKIRRKPLPILLTWNGPLDPQNPVNWSRRRKQVIELACCAMTFIVSFATTIFFGAVPVTATQFDASTETMFLSVSLYILGMLIFAPLSEIYGRARPMFLGLFFFLVLQAPIALAQNLPAIFICRFLTGAAGFSIIAIFPAMTVDLFSSSDRGPAVDLYVLAFNTGPCFGSLAGGFLVDALDWRWTIWIVLILGVVCCSIGFLAISETCEAVLLQRKAAQVRFETKNWAMHSSVDELPITWKMMRQKYMLKPVMMLFRDPILFIITIYTSLIDGITYLTFFAFPFSFTTVRHWRSSFAALPILAIVTGLCAGMILVKLFFNPWWQRRLAANDNRIKPEDRLPLMIAGAFVLPIGLFWFAWTSHLSVSWVAHVLSGLFIGAGAMAIFVSSVAYLVDVYLLDANSALSANRFVRFCFSAAFPLFSNYMYHRLGVDWATSLIAFLTVAMIPFPVLFWYKGEQIRGGSKLNHDL